MSALGQKRTLTFCIPDLPLKAQDELNPVTTAGDYFLKPTIQWRSEPLRHDTEDLHLRQMRSPAHELVNGRRQERQLRTLGSISISGAGFIV